MCILALVLIVLVVVAGFVVKGQKGEGKSSDGKNLSMNQEQSEDESSSDEASDKGHSKEKDSNGKSSNQNSGGKGGAIVGTPNPVVNNTGKNGNKNKNNGAESDEPSYISFPYTASADKLVIQSLDSYSGYYIEDGSEAEVKNISVIEVKNTSKKVIEYARINLTSKGKTLSFDVSLLPPGKSAVVMEAGKKEYNSNTSCTYVGSQIAYLSKLEKMEDKVKVTTDKKGAVKVTNVSGKKIPELRIFYKNKLGSGEYIGGIAYTVKFENLKSKESQTIYPSHFNSEFSEIMMVRTYN